MIFTIFTKTGEIHFDHDGFDDYDGDTGYPVDIEVDDEQVETDLAAFVVDNYLEREVDYAEYKRLRSVVKSIIEDYDLFDRMCEDYADELWEFYEEAYNRG